MAKTPKPSKTRPTPLQTGPRRDLGSRPPAPDRDDDRRAFDEPEERRDRRHAGTVRSAYSVIPERFRDGFYYAEQSRGGRRGRQGRDLLEVAGAGARALSQLVALWADLMAPLLPRGLPIGRLDRLLRQAEYDDEEYEARYRRRERDDDDNDDDDVGDDSEGRERPQRRRERDDDEIAVNLEITSIKPVVVSLKLDRGLLPEQLHVPPLAAHGEKDKKPISAGVLVEEEERVTVRLVVPDEQPAGTYEAGVFSADGTVRYGRLKAIVRDAGAARKAAS